MAGPGGGPVQEGDRDQEADERQGRQTEAGEGEDDSEDQSLHRAIVAPFCNSDCRKEGLRGPLAGWEWGRKTPLECRFRRIGGRGSNSVRRIRSNPRGHGVLQSGTEWDSVASQSWS
jgi:hypothetical protein